MDLSIDLQDMDKSDMDMNKSDMDMNKSDMDLVKTLDIMGRKLVSFDIGNSTT